MRVVFRQYNVRVVPYSRNMIISTPTQIIKGTDEDVKAVTDSFMVLKNDTDAVISFNIPSQMKSPVGNDISPISKVNLSISITDPQSKQSISLSRLPMSNDKIDDKLSEVSLNINLDTYNFIWNSITSRYTSILRESIFFNNIQYNSPLITLEVEYGLDE